MSTDQRQRGDNPQYSRVLIIVADGARNDLAEKLLNEGKLPQIKKHIVDRGCYKKALTVFPSTTGPAHIPFVTGLHPGTANIPGYRWLCRETHDSKKRSIYRHRSLNSIRGLMVGRDMDPEKSTSLYEYFENPSSVLELIDYSPSRPLSKIIVRRLLRIVQAHKSDDWSHVDNMVEREIIKRIKAGSECIIGSFFGIDEYSHLYDPFDHRTIEAYENIDRAVGEIVKTLIDQGVYEETIIAIVSDHGLSATKVHIPLVDIVKEHGFTPHFYPKLYPKNADCSVLESGNAMAMIYFKRGEKWGKHWTYNEIQNDNRTKKLIDTLVNREGITFAGARISEGGVIFVGKNGTLKAIAEGDYFDVTIDGDNPLIEHPTGRLSKRELFETTYNHTYPDAVNQLSLLFNSKRSGDIAISSEPGYDLRLQYEDPEHFSSHGSLHREHMHVPLMISIPIDDEFVYNYDIPPTILALTGKTVKRKLDGSVLSVNGERLDLPLETSEENDQKQDESKGNLSSILTTIGIILSGIILTAIFKEDIRLFGEELMKTYGEGWVDIILFLLTAISSTPLALPIWAYALVGIAMGYNIWWLAFVMAIGSASGSFVTFLLGKYFGQTDWVKKKFPNIHNHPWAYGKSRAYVTLFLFLGTASPIPCDIFYVACGAKKYPGVIFWPTMVAARFVRYSYLGYIFKYFPEAINYIF